jgi:hypothetical protein
MDMKNSKPLIEILNSYINNINIPNDRNIGTVTSLLIWCLKCWIYRDFVRIIRLPAIKGNIIKGKNILRYDCIYKNYCSFVE